MKTDSKNYKGIEYVLFDELPAAQGEILLQTLGQNAFIKILINGQIVSRCIQYKDYSFWFDTTYKAKAALAKEARIHQSIEIMPNLALNKI